MSVLCPWDSPDKNTGVGCSGLLKYDAYIVFNDHMNTVKYIILLFDFFNLRIRQFKQSAQEHEG